MTPRASHGLVDGAAGNHRNARNGNSRPRGAEGYAADEAFRAEARAVSVARVDPRCAASADPDPGTGGTDADTDSDAGEHPAPLRRPRRAPAPPTGGSCSLPPSSNPNDHCTMQTPAFLGAVDKAITLLTQQQPSIFNVNNNICENCYYVKDVSAYTAGVIRNLNAAGYCALYDGEELAVKNSNSFNEQYDILISSGHIRRGAGSYRSTCNPAWF